MTDSKNLTDEQIKDIREELLWFASNIVETVESDTISKNLTDEQINYMREYSLWFTSLVETVENDIIRYEFPEFMQSKWKEFLMQSKWKKFLTVMSDENKESKND